MTSEPHLQAGGTLNPPQHLYVERAEDETFLVLLLQRQYVNVLGSRQTGKSSMMMRAVHRLSHLGVHWITIDLAAELGSPADLDAYYVGLLSKIVNSLDLRLDLKAWWLEHNTETVNQRLLHFFRTVGAGLIDPLVIFLDEIDSTLKLPYADDLFTAIRGMYNERPIVPEYRLITFCLLGVAMPGELVKSPRTTAYNVGTNLELRDFDKAVDDLSPLAAALNPDAELGSRLLDRVLFWSGGQPYLTQKLCASIVGMRIGDVGGLDQFVRRTFATIDQTSDDVHFQQIVCFLEERPSTAVATIDLYARLLQTRRISDGATPAHAELRLSGLVKRDRDGSLVVRNPIYRHLFDISWIKNARLKRTVGKVLRHAVAASLVIATLAGAALAYYAAVVRPEQGRQDMLAGLAAGDDLMARGDLASALKSYRDSVAAIERLAKTDPGNAGWRRDLSMSYDKIGNILMAQDNPPEALKAFRDGLAVAGHLAQATPGNAGWQRDLSVFHNKIGDVLMAQGNLPEALKAFRDGLAIRERLAQADPGDAGAQRDLILSCVRTAQADPARARALLTRAGEIVQQLRQRGQVEPRDAAIAVDIARRIDALPKAN
jgi:hypothetical protein